MKYFGELTGIEYPYEKYDQIIVDEFMFGGMENITLHTIQIELCTISMLRQM